MRREPGTVGKGSPTFGRFHEQIPLWTFIADTVLIWDAPLLLTIEFWTSATTKFGSFLISTHAERAEARAKTTPAPRVTLN